MELHSDGTGFAARAITTTTAPPNAADRGMNEAGQYFHTLTIESSIVEILDILAHHAVHTGGGGDFSVRAELLPGIINIAAAGRPPGPHLNRTVALIEDFRNRGGSYEERVILGSHPLTVPEPLDTVVPASIVISASDLVAAAADIASEIIAEFGEPPNLTLLQRDGSVVSEAADRPDAASIRGWAQTQGLIAPASAR